MAQFFIELPNSSQGNVKTGVMRKKRSLMNILMPWKKINTEEKLAYIVEVNPVHDIREYRLLKTKDGKWLQEGEDDWLREGDGKLNLLIKKAIDEYESRITKTA